MTDERKRRVSGRRTKTTSVHAESVLWQFNCTSLEYKFEFPLASFNYKRFSKLTGINRGQRWSTVLPTKDPAKAYHVHFDGEIESKSVRITLEYWNRAVGPEANETEPFSESIMKWIGSFVRETTARATVAAHFKKPTSSWRSRFNLPFKVTMGGLEVVIDGVSLELPRNPYRAVFALLTIMGEELSASVHGVRPIEFSAFDLGTEVISFNESLKIFLEQVS